MKKLLGIAFIALLVPLGGFSAEPAAVSKEESSKPSGGRVGKPAEIMMEEVEIRGELERPDVFYIIPRRKATMDLGELSKDYKEEIMQPMLPSQFEQPQNAGKK